jgi:hypothetical protein
MGGGRGCYAGQPHTFRCAKCKRGADAQRQPRVGIDVSLTGRSREQHAEGMNVHHWKPIALEYKCNVCGHVGWSRHPTLAHRAAR